MFGQKTIRLISVWGKKKVIRRQGPCLICGSLSSPLAGLDLWKQGDRDTMCSRVTQVQKENSHSILPFASHQWHQIKTPKWQQQSRATACSPQSPRGTTTTGPTPSPSSYTGIWETHTEHSQPAGSIFPIWSRKGSCAIVDEEGWGSVLHFTEAFTFLHTSKINNFTNLTWDVLKPVLPPHSPTAKPEAKTHICILYK